MSAKRFRHEFSNFVFSVIDQAGINQDTKNIRSKLIMSAKRFRHKFSNFVFSVIDQAGLNQDIKMIRVRWQTDLVFIISKRFFDHLPLFGDIILTGSTSEGVIPFSISDFDCMMVHNDIICVEDPNGETNSKINFLKPDYEDVSPGYIKVIPVHINTDTDDDISLASSFCPMSYLYKSETGEPYISSVIFNNFIKQLFEFDAYFTYDYIIRSQPEYNGPATTRSVSVNINSSFFRMSPFPLEIDYVNAIYFYNSNILTQWETRSRWYDWPSKELVKKVSTMEGFILPIGEKESENENLEWRISYVTAEKKLLLNFYSTHDKVYVILKMLKKQVFSSVCKAFSSYMVKNTILWMAEMNPSGGFTPELFIDRLLQSLSFIKLCLQNNHLPNYIMPKRNLLAGRVFGQEKQELISLLSELINEEENIVHRLPKLSMYVHYVAIKPELFACYGIWRNYVETTIMVDFYLTSTQFKPELLSTSLFVDLQWLCFQDERCFAVRLALFKLLVPDYVEKYLQGRFSEIYSLAVERYKAVLSCCFMQ